MPDAMYIREQGEWIGSTHREQLISAVWHFGGKLYEVGYVNGDVVSVYEGNPLDLWRSGQTIRDLLGDNL